MKFEKISVRFQAPDIAEAEERICNIFFSIGLQGVVCDIPLEEPDEGFGTHTLPLPETFSITGYLPVIQDSDTAVTAVRQRADELKAVGISTRVVCETVDDRDWADAWKTYFEVSRVTDRIVIQPRWKTYTPDARDIVIQLDPGMAFGTGTHPTTAMCLNFLDRLLKPGDTFLDVGTGSGILMVAALKLGASRALGIDTDAAAVSIARENLAFNGLPPDRYSLSCATLDQTPTRTWDLVAANIIAQVIVTILPDLVRRMSASSLAVLAGIIRDRRDQVMDALQGHGLCVAHESGEDEWVTLVVKFNPGIGQSLPSMV